MIWIKENSRKEKGEITYMNGWDLGRDEERDWFLKAKKDGGDEARNEFLSAYFDFAVNYTHGNKKFGKYLDRDDRESEGCVALLDAWEDYNPKSGFRFSTYLGIKIKERLKRGEQLYRRNIRAVNERWNIGAKSKYDMSNRKGKKIPVSVIGPQTVFSLENVKSHQKDSKSIEPPEFIGNREVEELVRNGLDSLNYKNRGIVSKVIYNEENVKSQKNGFSSIVRETGQSKDSIKYDYMNGLSELRQNRDIYSAGRAMGMVE